MLSELHSFSTLRDSLCADVNTKLEATQRYLKNEEYKSILARARTLI